MLSFIRNRETNNTWIAGKEYQLLQFEVREFLSFVGKTKSPYYQSQKIITFVGNLQYLKPVKDFFIDENFRNFLSFQFLEVSKKRKGSVGRLAVSSSLFSYNYPFMLPEVLLNTSQTAEFKVKMFVVQSFFVSNFYKTFLVKKFFTSFSASN